MFRNITAVLAALLIVVAPCARAQSPLPQFEVASIKKSVYTFSSIRASGDHFFANGWTLRDLLVFAYSPCDGSGLLDSQVVGVPGWADKDRFDIEAKAGGVVEIITRCQTRPMVQSLLQNRFNVKVHFETREMPVYALVVVKPGKLKQSDDQTPPISRDDLRLAAPPKVSRGVFTLTSGRSGPSSLIISGTALRIDRVIYALQLASPEFQDRHVIDKTNLQGLFDIHLEFAAPQSITVSEVPYPTLHTALQEQLGLKLESARGPVEVLVIDSVSKPTEN